ncbi:hypothetical protein [Sporomusa sp.]|uniref:hypothetical protein n=1 Tax=Sporomusa sp. TaxID=2078658 RepID=UPI002C987829|nr:hypothetical protein [Sporomusa sp.]HWR06450.1 hypothetical protein [Sporomusa sp.]
MKHEQIKQLTDRLLACGYHPSQIKQMISEAECGITANDSRREQLIIAALEDYVEFGTKCKMTRKPVSSDNRRLCCE